MNRIDEISKLLLVIFIFSVCNCWEGDSTKGDWKSGSSPFYIYFLLVVFPSITPDAACTTDIAGKPKLQQSTPIQASTSQLYLIYPEKKPIKVKITLLENNCQVYRNYFYCSGNKLKSGSVFQTTQGISCSDGSITRDPPIEGNTGTFEECTLSYDGEFYQVDISFVPKRECKHEVRYD